MLDPQSHLSLSNKLLPARLEPSILGKEAWLDSLTHQEFRVPKMEESWTL